jgi:hypothetical protein
MEHGHSSRSLTQERRVSSTVSAARRGGRIVVIPGVLSSYRALEYGLKIAPVERQRGFEPHSPQPFFCCTYRGGELLAGQGGRSTGGKSSIPRLVEHLLRF